MICRWRGRTLLQQADRPAFEGLGHQGVIGVADRSAGDLPGLVPLEVVLVDQQAHQLGDGERRMGVVELDGDLSPGSRGGPRRGGGSRG